jgi:polyhydroxyalkanoate synthase subunit PhaC
MLRRQVDAQDREQDVHPLDRAVHRLSARFTRGISPAALALAYYDWAVHLAMYPGKQLELARDAGRKYLRLMNYAGRCATGADVAPCLLPQPGDTRFDAPQWEQWPFNVIVQNFLLAQEWWARATSEARGVDPHHQDVVHFVGRQLLDMYSPSNYLSTNPEVLQRTAEERGQNLVRGWQNFVDDLDRQFRNRPPAGTEGWGVGKNLALTPGKVIYRNRLMELIQYEPTTKNVHAHPVLFVPAWIMKYYILDLAPGKSLVEFLRDQGHTVFMISWKNPGSEEREMGMDDYRKLGIMAALDAIGAVVPEQKVNAVGYCLGGTLLALTAADMARDGDDRLGSVSMFAAQVDFTEPGELDHFIDESQVSYLEDYMWQQGYLDAYQMAGAFQLLRSDDLLWSRIIHEYLMGERTPVIDLMAWNADATRLPYKMHSEYLRSLFLNNDFVEENFIVDGHPIAPSDIKVPIFSVGTVKDHVAPWKSVYKINRLARTEVTFLLTTGGHNAGIITPPGHPRRKYQVRTSQAEDRYVPPEQFHAEMPFHTGSWWPEWQSWLAAHSGAKVKPPQIGLPGKRPLADAPGEYVLQQ